MNAPQVPGSYPRTESVIPPKTITLSVVVEKEEYFINKNFGEISAHYYKMAMDLSCLQMGANQEGEDLLLNAIVFQTSKGLYLMTGKFGEIKFPEDFELVGEI